MIETIREHFGDDVEYFTDFELAYFIGYERIPMDELCENETLWKLRSWGKYENYIDAAEQIFGEATNGWTPFVEEFEETFTDEFYKQDLVYQMDEARDLLQRAGYPILVTEDFDIWVKRTDWK